MDIESAENERLLRCNNWMRSIADEEVANGYVLFRQINNPRMTVLLNYLERLPKSDQLTVLYAYIKRANKDASFLSGDPLSEYDHEIVRDVWYRIRGNTEKLLHDYHVKKDTEKPKPWNCSIFVKLLSTQLASVYKDKPKLALPNVWSYSRQVDDWNIETCIEMPVSFGNRSINYYHFVRRADAPLLPRGQMLRCGFPAGFGLPVSSWGEVFAEDETTVAQSIGFLFDINWPMLLNTIEGLRINP